MKIKRATRQNFINLYNIMIWNVKHDIHLYRASSNMCPLNTHELCEYDFMKDNFIIDISNKIKKLSVDNNIRMSIHPDQFNVINSVDDNVFQNTLVSLQYHYNLIELLGIDVCCIHVGSKVGGIREAQNRFIQNFYKLPQYIQDVLCLENDDKSFNVNSTLSLCEKLNIPMILDFHHDRCLKSKFTVEEYIDRILNTWNNKTPKAHLSTGRFFITDKSHADSIDIEDFEYVKTIWNYDLMLECKNKEISLLNLLKK